MQSTGVWRAFYGAFCGLHFVAMDEGKKETAGLTFGICIVVRMGPSAKLSRLHQR
jgi:hypothetical protein